MMRKSFIIPGLIIFFIISHCYGQSSLSIEKIMQDPKTWIGTSPTQVFWSEDGQKVYFNWNPDQNTGDSLYFFSIQDQTIKKSGIGERISMPARNGDYNKTKTQKTYLKDGDVYVYDLNGGKEVRVIDLAENIAAVKFSSDDRFLLFELSDNLFSWEIGKGTISQLTNLKSGTKKSDPKMSEQDKWLQTDQMEIMEVLNERKQEEDLRKKVDETEDNKTPFEIFIGNKNASNFQLSPDAKYITYTLFSRPQDSKRTEVANYVTESGYTETLNARTKVGTSLSSQEVWIYNIEKGSVYMVATDTLPGIEDIPDYYADYDKYTNIKPEKREVFTHGPVWSENGKYAVVNFRSKDNKDRWIMLLNPEDGSSRVLDRQRDEAWVSGPGIGSSYSMGSMGWLSDNKTLWFQSEVSGYSHLYTVNVESGKKKALTSGNFEVYNLRISNDKTKFYFEANVVHPGVRHLYSIPVNGGKIEQITYKEGKNDIFISPDESWIAILYSSANTPDELYLKRNEKGSQSVQITNSTTPEFNSYSWRIPEFITFKARDNAVVHARLYKPQDPKIEQGPAIIFVHGAGYLQNAHKWWSSYFREYMFHNFLVDNGYTVLDIDYRGSAGYGRDWRTAIYRHMGGWDLNDQVDGAKFLVQEHGIDPDKIGIYGGSYGGFITLMALFTEPDVFAAGAALRSVTDWAHYNHGYTSNILNTPVEDSLAYRRSSPIYFAEGLNKPLLIAHGMVDTNVHFQDVVRLAQRLIELGKDDWEMAVYPVENHGFREPSSWTDEYKRIYKLFESNLK